MEDKHWKQVITKRTIFDSLISSFFNEKNLWWINEMHIPRGQVVSDLHDIFSEYNELNELDEKVFWKQINRFRRQYAKEKDGRITALRSIVYFYLYLIAKYPEVGLFENARTLYPSLLENRAFVTEWLEEGCKFMTFTPGIKYENHDKYIFVFRGADNTSSKIKKNDYKKIDLSSVKSPFFRKCIFDYICSDVNRLHQYSPTHYNSSLNLISDLKASEGYINTSEQYLTTSELIHMTEGLLIKLKGKTDQLQTYIGTLKSFFLWCEEQGYIQVDDTFNDGLITHRDRATAPKTKRPEAEHIDILLEASSKKAEEDPSCIPHDAILRLLLTTKLRVSAICNLERDCVTPNLKPNSFTIRYIDKTSHGDADSTVITARDKSRLDKVMQSNEKLLERTKPELKNYIFLFVPNRKNYVKVADSFTFRYYLMQLCEENKLPAITATQLRREYQSQAKRFAIKEKLDDHQEKTLTGHSHPQTTDKHYVKTRLEEYLEQMYMVSLQDRKREADISAKVRDSVPAKLEKVGDGMYQCGACNATSCMVRNALPCFVCKDFITSTEFLPVFKRMVENVDEQIYSSPNMHDKEDFTAVKEVLVRYIAELTLKLQDNE